MQQFRKTEIIRTQTAENEFTIGKITSYTSNICYEGKLVDTTFRRINTQWEHELIEQSEKDYKKSV